MKMFLIFGVLLIGSVACDANRGSMNNDADNVNRANTRSNNDIQREEADESYEPRRSGTTTPYEGTGINRYNENKRNKKSSRQSGASSSDTDKNGAPLTR